MLLVQTVAVLVRRVVRVVAALVRPVGRLVAVPVRAQGSGKGKGKGKAKERKKRKRREPHTQHTETRTTHTHARTHVEKGGHANNDAFSLQRLRLHRKLHGGGCAGRVAVALGGGAENALLSTIWRYFNVAAELHGKSIKTQHGLTWKFVTRKDRQTVLSADASTPV